MSEFNERDREALREITKGIGGIQDTVREVSQEGRMNAERLDNLKEQFEELRRQTATFATKDGLQTLSDSWDKAFEKTATLKELEDMKEVQRNMIAQFEIMKTDLTLMRGSINTMKFGMPFIVTIIGAVIALLGVIFK